MASSAPNNSMPPTGDEIKALVDELSKKLLTFIPEGPLKERVMAGSRPHGMNDLYKNRLYSLIIYYGNDDTIGVDYLKDLYDGLDGVPLGDIRKAPLRVQNILWAVLTKTALDRRGLDGRPVTFGGETFESTRAFNERVGPVVTEIDDATKGVISKINEINPMKGGRRHKKTHKKRRHTKRKTHKRKTHHRKRR
jgi:hypothetical protein